jgi:hypothetical protein
VGWASASEIFDPVARALIDLGADAPTKRKVLGTLLGKLRDEDWDTADESLDEFRDDPVIVQIFYEQGVGNSAGNWPVGAPASLAAGVPRGGRRRPGRPAPRT